MNITPSIALRYVTGILMSLIVVAIALKLVFNLSGQEFSVQSVFGDHLEAGYLILLLFVAVGVIGALYTHIRSLSKTHEELVTRYGVLEKKEHIKTKFLAYAAHNLRTPATALKWSLGDFVKTQKESLSPDQYTQIESMNSVANTILSTIENFLTISKMELQKMEISVKETTLGEFTHSLRANLENLTPLSREKRVAVFSRFSTNDTAPFDADIPQLLSACNNLIENALQYTKEGGAVLCTVHNNADNVHISVTDDGIGIPDAEQPSIFSEFFRSTNAKVLKSTGDGIGLYISKAIVEAHDGSISFISKENVGTTFHMTIPLQSARKRGVFQVFERL